MARNGTRFPPKEKREIPAVIATRAILLRRTRLGETSLVTHWLTAEAGRLKAVAKAARKPGGPFAGKLDLFYESDILVVRSRKSDLHALRETALVEPHDGLRRDLRAVALAAYFVELIEANTEPEHPVPELFDLLRRALRHLAAHPPSRRALLHFEKELASLLGLAGETGTPPHEAIARHAGKLPPARAGLIAPGHLD